MWMELTYKSSLAFEHKYGDIFVPNFSANHCLLGIYFEVLKLHLLCSCL